jgi:hypothetical protein
MTRTDSRCVPMPGAAAPSPITGSLGVSRDGRVAPSTESGARRPVPPESP